MITPSRHTQPVYDWYEANWTTCRDNWVISLSRGLPYTPAEETHWEAMHILSMEAND